MGCLTEKDTEKVTQDMSGIYSSCMFWCTPIILCLLHIVLGTHEEPLGIYIEDSIICCWYL